MKTCRHNSIRHGLPASSSRSRALPARALDLALWRTARTAAALSATLALASAQVGSNYCTAAPNSTGAGASISATGSTYVSLNDLVLTTVGMPTHAAAYFLSSRSQGVVQNPGGTSGNVCLGNPIGQLVGGVVANSGAAGTVSVTADLFAMPQPAGTVLVMPGETWNFQCWFRDSLGGTATSNFSDGLEVLFEADPQGMVPIPPGTFAMGSNAPNVAPYWNGHQQQPVHQVTISYPFWMGEHEVTQAQVQALMGKNPSLFQGVSLPVETVSWFDARAYCAALTAQETAAGNVPAGYEYRLPTEAEWEYACRAGTTTEFHYGPDLYCGDANFRYSYHSNSSCNASGTVAVGSYAPNAWGLYDMHGNVLEWCLDSYASYSPWAMTDPFKTGGTNRVNRGGSWFTYSHYCRSAFRFRSVPVFSGNRIGFRVVLAPVLVP